MITHFFRKKNAGSEGVVLREKSIPDELASPRKNQQRHPRLFKLASDVKASCLKGGAKSNERFLPNDKLEQLVTRESVLLCLQETTIKQENYEDLATWVLENGKRLFLILVLLTRESEEQLSRLGELKNDGINDGALPLGLSEIEPYYGYSLAADTDGARKFHSFQDWEDNNLILFKIYQWLFLAPVFGANSKFRHQLRSEQPLPLLNQVKQPASSNVLGEICRAEIHPAHIDSKCLSALEVNNSGVQGLSVCIKKVQPSDNLHPFFDIDTGNFKARHPIISPYRIKPIASHKKNGEDFVIFLWIDDGNLNI
ncbi:hypothetical protein F4860DRAFT_507649 [Xylaria cubensis]|nr:hypothetical protein F4860DRAFT_507649 [Xylaria cubensis]